MIRLLLGMTDPIQGTSAPVGWQPEMVIDTPCLLSGLIVCSLRTLAEVDFTTVFLEPFDSAAHRSLTVTGEICTLEPPSDPSRGGFGDQPAHPHDVVRGGCEIEDPFDACAAAMPEFPEQCDCFIHPKACSTCLRFRWLIAYPGCRVVRSSMALRRRSPVANCATCGVARGAAART